MNNHDCIKFRRDTCKGTREDCYPTCAIMHDVRAAEGLFTGMKAKDYDDN